MATAIGHRQLGLMSVSDPSLVKRRGFPWAYMSKMALNIDHLESLNKVKLLLNFSTPE